MEPFADELILRSIFSEFGRIMSCLVVRDEQRVSKGYGFVNFEDKTSIDNAIKACNGRPLFGRSLDVREKGVRMKKV